MLRAVLFDLDDTLYRELDFVASGFDAVASHAAETLCLDERALRHALDAALAVHGRGHTFDRALEAQGLAHDAVVRALPELVRVYRTHRPKLALLEDADRCLRELAAANLATGIVTDGDPDAQRAKVSALGLHGRVDVERYSWDAGAAFQKPHPSAFEPALAALATRGIRPHQVAYVGDNPTKDFVGARALGLTTMRVRRGPHSAVMVAPELEADGAVDSLDELVPWALGWAANAERALRRVG